MIDASQPHFSQSWAFLLLIPLIFWLRLRRARRSAAASDFWFEPEGDSFIYHPFGRFGAAYLVDAGTRLVIREKMAAFTRVVAGVVMLAAIGPIALMSLDQATYWAWRPDLTMIRLGLVLALIPIGLLWRLVAIRPLYAAAPPAPRRISVASIRAKQVAARSFWSIGIVLGLMIALSVGFLYAAYVQQNPTNAVMAALFAVVAAFNLRALLTKLRLRNS